MNVYDENGRELMSAQLKRQTLNVTLPRQSLLEIIKSYVQPSSIYTEHVVTGLEQTNSKVTVHFSEQESEAFDLCIGADGLHSKSKKRCKRLLKLIIKAILVLEDL